MRILIQGFIPNRTALARFLLVVRWWILSQKIRLFLKAVRWLNQTAILEPQRVYPRVVIGLLKEMSMMLMLS